MVYANSFACEVVFTVQLLRASHRYEIIPVQYWSGLPTAGWYRESAWPSLENYRGYRETQRVIVFTCCKIKVKTCFMNVHITQTQLRESESESCISQKCVLSSNRLCTGQFSIAVGVVQWHRKKHWCNSWKLKNLKGQRPTRPWHPPSENEACRRRMYFKRKREKKVLKVVKSHVVSSKCALILSYPSSRLAVATSWDLHYTLGKSTQ